MKKSEKYFGQTTKMLVVKIEKIEGKLYKIYSENLNIKKGVQKWKIGIKQK